MLLSGFILRKSKLVHELLQVAERARICWLSGVLPAGSATVYSAVELIEPGPAADDELPGLGPRVGHLVARVPHRIVAGFVELDRLVAVVLPIEPHHPADLVETGVLDVLRGDQRDARIVRQIARPVEPFDLLGDQVPLRQAAFGVPDDLGELCLIHSPASSGGRPGQERLVADFQDDVVERIDGRGDLANVGVEALRPDRDA